MIGQGLNLDFKIMGVFFKKSRLWKWSQKYVGTNVIKGLFLKYVGAGVPITPNRVNSKTM